MSNLIVESARWNTVETGCLQGTLAATDGLDGGGDIMAGVLTITFQFRSIAIAIIFAVIYVIIRK